ncbi:hypothetical protein GCU60_08955 [Blastococcus saxobsidens]|uniref:Uncharacterized protein n=1 Tax=Blastococcus saxobsidens TaxID=138336 RepID=A0A6L9W354_9ACTN|nr:hypothetical protein [Blastococcus saxobsidens]NEK85890.1 hypothetical protein [Blastococcus saxobsidens]
MSSWTTKVLGAAGAVVAVGATALAGLAVTMPAGVDGPGAMLAELQGHTETSDHADAADAPRADVPGWTRSVGHDVTVVRPGNASGDDAGSVRAHMTLDEGARPPADCVDLSQVGMPFDGGGNWPDLGEAAQLCEGWVTVVLDDRLYTWSDDALQVEAG